MTIGAGREAAILHVMNEYMALDDADGERLATFPDVLTTLGPAGEPSASGRSRKAMSFGVSRAKAHLPLVRR